MNLGHPWTVMLIGGFDGRSPMKQKQVAELLAWAQMLMPPGCDGRIIAVLHTDSQIKQMSGKAPQLNCMLRQAELRAQWRVNRVLIDPREDTREPLTALLEQQSPHLVLLPSTGCMSPQYWEHLGLPFNELARLRITPAFFPQEGLA